MERNEAIRRIKAALKKRSGKSWSVTGGKGTAWGWITIHSLPSKRDSFGCMTSEDREELGKLLGLENQVHFQGVSIPAATDYREEYIARAEGRQPLVLGKPYWD